MDISQFFIRGDVKGAIEYMKEHDEYKDILPMYIAIFEEEKYRFYDVPSILNDILLLYQKYYRSIFYFGIPEAKASEKLLKELNDLLETKNADEATLASKLQEVFKENGYCSQFGKTQGFFGPYVWKETVPTIYKVDLPGGTAEYKVNILKGFVFRSWMDYLTFGRFGTGGWASPDGTINCIEMAYDFNSERFLVSLLKHEAQHTVDMKSFPGILTAELEYRAKLVELHYSNNLALLDKFLAEVSDARPDDSHGLASFWVKKAFDDVDKTNIENIQKRALELFDAHTKEMEEKYNK